jgi:biotin transport system substrate-specific component
MLAGNALCLVGGAPWLAVLVGPQKALLLGVAPFIVGGVLKSALAAALVKAMGATVRRLTRA